MDFFNVSNLITSTPKQQTATARLLKTKTRKLSNSDEELHAYLSNLEKSKKKTSTLAASSVYIKSDMSLSSSSKDILQNSTSSSLGNDFETFIKTPGDKTQIQKKVKEAEESIASSRKKSFVVELDSEDAWGKVIVAPDFDQLQVDEKLSAKSHELKEIIEEVLTYSQTSIPEEVQEVFFDKRLRGIGHEEEIENCLYEYKDDFTEESESENEKVESISSEKEKAVGKVLSAEKLQANPHPPLNSRETQTDKKELNLTEQPHTSTHFIDNKILHRKLELIPEWAAMDSSSIVIVDFMKQQLQSLQESLNLMKLEKEFDRSHVPKRKFTTLSSTMRVF